MTQDQALRNTYFLEICWGSSQEKPLRGNQQYREEKTQDCGVSEA